MKENSCTNCHAILPEDYDANWCDWCLSRGSFRRDYRESLARELIKVAHEATTPLELVEIWNKAESFDYGYCDAMRYAVIGNPQCPDYLLRFAACHEESGYRITVACNPKAHKYFESLASDPDSYVRRYLAENQSVPIEIIVTLLDDGIGYVRWFAKRNLNRRQES